MDNGILSKFYNGFLPDHVIQRIQDEDEDPVTAILNYFNSLGEQQSGSGNGNVDNSLSGNGDVWVHNRSGYFHAGDNPVRVYNQYDSSISPIPSPTMNVHDALLALLTIMHNMEMGRSGELLKDLKSKHDEMEHVREAFRKQRDDLQEAIAEARNRAQQLPDGQANYGTNFGGLIWDNVYRNIDNAVEGFADFLGLSGTGKDIFVAFLSAIVTAPVALIEFTTSLIPTPDFPEVEHDPNYGQISPEDYAELQESSPETFEFLNHISEAYQHYQSGNHSAGEASMEAAGRALDYSNVDTDSDWNNGYTAIFARMRDWGHIITIRHLGGENIAASIAYYEANKDEIEDTNVHAAFANYYAAQLSGYKNIHAGDKARIDGEIQHLFSLYQETTNNIKNIYDFAAKLIKEYHETTIAAINRMAA